MTDDPVDLSLDSTTDRDGYPWQDGQPRTTREVIEDLILDARDYMRRGDRAQAADYLRSAAYLLDGRS